jgi:hypothetical protein
MGTPNSNYIALPLHKRVSKSTGQSVPVHAIEGVGKSRDTVATDECVWSASRSGPFTPREKILIPFE